MRPSDDELDPALQALEDSYELVRELGGTNATVVYLARVRSSGRLVALKMIRPQFLKNPEAAARFAREARTMSSLEHPNIVRTLAVEQLGDRTVAIVMEYLEGGTLRELLRSHGALSFEHARAILGDLGNAIKYSHEHGIVHRDVKPENIFIEADSGRALLSDFGIAREIEADTRLTLAGSAVGTPTYMSPEQIDGQEADERSDIYSLGVLGWELITGLRPWEGETLYGVIYKQKHEDLPPILALRADTPASLREAIEGAMRKREDDRWPSAAAFLERLGAVDKDALGRAGEGASDDLPTLHFRRPEETLRGVSLADVALAAEANRPTQPVEREVSLQPVREPKTEVAQEPEVRRPRHTQPRRKMNPGDVPIPDVDVTAANSAAIAAAAAAAAAQMASEAEELPAEVTMDATEIAEDEAFAEAAAAEVPAAPAEIADTLAADDVESEGNDFVVVRPDPAMAAEFRASSRRQSLRPSTDVVGDTLPEVVPPPRRRNPLLIAVPAVLALAAALLVMARRDDAPDERASLIVEDSVVSQSSGGNIAPSVGSGGENAPATRRRTGTTNRTPAASESSKRGTSTSPARPNTTAATSRTEGQTAARRQSPPAELPGAPVVRPPVVQRDAAEEGAPLNDQIADNDVELNRVYQQLVGALRRNDGGDAESAAVRDLRAQQRAWLMRRDAACRSGTIDERASCFRDQSQLRSTELNRRLEAARAGPDTSRP